uniref:Uncharacterized protein n=1 Tax=Heterosigma akashiwo TaxID=2829 RepID=A0A7S4DDZ7_HETAK
MAARRALVPLWLILTSFTFTNGVSETNQIFNNEVVSEARPSFDIGEEPSSSISDEQLQNHMEDLGISSHLGHHEAENSENHAPKPYESGSMPASSTDQQNGPDPNSVQMVLLTCGTRSCDKDDFSRGNDDEPTLGDIFRNLQKKFSGISEDEVSKKLEELLPISVVERARRMGGRRMAIPFTFAPLEWLGGLWSAAEFEVDRLPPALHPALALARRPARLGALYAWWYDTALIPGLVFTLQFLPRLAKTLAVQLLEVMPDPDEMIKPVITYPCDAERSKGLFYWLFPGQACQSCSAYYYYR